MMKLSPRLSAVFLHDLVMIVLAWELAWFARFNLSMPPSAFWEANLNVLPFVVLFQVLINWRFNLYKGIWRFASLPDLWNIVRAAGLGIAAVILFSFIATRLDDIPRSILLFYPVNLILFLSLPRLSYRLIKDRSISLRASADAQRVLVIGAGRAGETVVRDMLRDHRYIPVGFIDDKPALLKRRIHGVPVLGNLAMLEKLVKDYDIQAILIAIPSADQAQIRSIVAQCELTGLRFMMLPRFSASETPSQAERGLRDVREVSIDDLLGREKVQLDWNVIQHGIAGRRVLVTGGGGSIGSELTRQIAELKPSSLMIFDQGEFNLYTIDRKLRKDFPNLQLESRIGDVHDMVSVDAAFRTFQPNVVFHAAAYKHVPILQNQIREALRNNVIGTRIVADAADRYGVEKFVLISTDKAVNPTSIMGASKRMAEMFCEAKNSTSQTRYITVRFGNVLGSAGSVVPLFKEQIATGGPVTVTHKDMTRFFMTIPEACQLILQAGAMGKGGEIFVLEMGEPISILYLAEQMIKLSGKQTDHEIQIQFTGLRPGEKLHEELFHDEENLVGTEHKKILLAKQRGQQWAEFEKLIEQVETACGVFDEDRALQIVRKLVPELIIEDKADSNVNVISFKEKKGEKL